MRILHAFNTVVTRAGKKWKSGRNIRKQRRIGYSWYIKHRCWRLLVCKKFQQWWKYRRGTLWLCWRNREKWSKFRAQAARRHARRPESSPKLVRRWNSANLHYNKAAVIIMILAFVNARGTESTAYCIWLTHCSGSKTTSCPEQVFDKEAVELEDYQLRQTLLLLRHLWQLRSRVWAW